MVSSHLRRARRRRTAPGDRSIALALALAIALLSLAACKREERIDATVGADAEEAAMLQVRGRYTATDAGATGAWAWTAPTGAAFVLVDVQSTEEGVVQGRLDLWAVTGQQVQAVGRSAVMSSAATFGAFAFEDVTGDGLPDFLGFVADSAEVAYTVFIPGASGMMTDEIELSAPGWRFSTDQQNAPSVVRGQAGPCALRLWAEEPAPDGQPAGWRFLEIRRRGAQLAAPSAAPPACAGAPSDSTSGP
jgi:hypothetical protein